MTARGRAAAALVAAAALATLFACSSDGAVSAGEKAPFRLNDRPVRTDHVELPKSYRFQPAVVEVPRGTTVVWTNHDDFPHTVQILAGAPTSKHDLPLGKTVSIRFDEPGTVYYHCSIHPAQMRGEVVVTG